MLAAGTRLTLSAQGQVDDWFVWSSSETSLRQAVLTALARNGRLAVLEMVVRSNEAFYSKTWTYTATLYVRTTGLLSSTEDVRRIVRDAFTVATRRTDITITIPTQGEPAHTPVPSSDPWAAGA